MWGSIHSALSLACRSLPTKCAKQQIHDSGDMAALLLIDVQYDFLPPDGSLAVAGGDEILPVLHRLLDDGRWDIVVASQDYHPPGHISFASRHSLPPFQTIELSATGALPSIKQELWPDHCVQGTKGCEIEESIRERVNDWADAGKGFVVRKGEDVDRDEYSAFRGSALASGSQLGKIVADNQIDAIFVAGLATDFCVNLSVSDAARDLAPGVKIHVIEDAVRGVDPANSAKILDDLASKGVRIVKSQSKEVARWLKS